MTTDALRATAQRVITEAHRDPKRRDHYFWLALDAMEAALAAAEDRAEGLDVHVPEVADGPFIASCSCGTWQPETIAAGSDGGLEWVAHVRAARLTPDRTPTE